MEDTHSRPASTAPPKPAPRLEAGKGPAGPKGGRLSIPRDEDRTLLHGRKPHTPGPAPEPTTQGHGPSLPKEFLVLPIFLKSVDLPHPHPPLFSVFHRIRQLFHSPGPREAWLRFPAWEGPQGAKRPPIPQVRRRAAPRAPGGRGARPRAQGGPASGPGGKTQPGGPRPRPRPHPTRANGPASHHRAGPEAAPPGQRGRCPRRYLRSASPGRRARCPLEAGRGQARRGARGTALPPHALSSRAQTPLRFPPFVTVPRRRAPASRGRATASAEGQLPRHEPPPPAEGAGADRAGAGWAGLPPAAPSPRLDRAAPVVAAARTSRGRSAPRPR